MAGEKPWPRIIQGGMGVGLSNWTLARAVAMRGQLGVVSGTAVDTVMVRRLQNGDLDGSVRRALAHFPSAEIAQRIIDRYFRSEPRKSNETFMLVPKPSLTPSLEAIEIVVVANFVEVWLAKEGHDGLVGINFLEKIQMATPPAILGAMLAKVDYVLMGAGIPREIPRLIKDFAEGKAGFINVEVIGTDPVKLILDPRQVLGDALPLMNAPKFLAIVSSDILASYLAKDESTRPDGFVIEGHLAGGHNAPPRSKKFDENNEPIYNERDEPNLVKMQTLDIPYWLAGAYGTPERVAEALAVGAKGVQVGTLFALCTDSGLTSEIRNHLLDEIKNDRLKISTDAAASPTGFPIKIAQLPGTLTDNSLNANRSALCDLGYLRVPFLNPNGRIDYRCAAEPDDMYVRKGGAADETQGRQCLCNGLTANIGLGQHRRSGYDELPLVTLGADLIGPKVLIESHPEGWDASTALDWLLSSV